MTRMAVNECADRMCIGCWLNTIVQMLTTLQSWSLSGQVHKGWRVCWEITGIVLVTYTSNQPTLFLSLTLSLVDSLHSSSPQTLLQLLSPHRNWWNMPSCIGSMVGPCCWVAESVEGEWGEFSIKVMMDLLISLTTGSSPMGVIHWKVSCIFSSMIDRLWWHDSSRCHAVRPQGSMIGV